MNLSTLTSILQGKYILSLTVSTVLTRTIKVIDEGNEELRQATSLLISAQARKACIICTVLLIIGLVIALAVVGSRGNSRSEKQK